MKKVLISLAILFSLSAGAQNVTQDSKGNYVAISHVKNDSTNYKESGKTYQDAKGVILKVYVSDKNKMFIKRISKAGNEYRYYLKLEAKN